ncbi:hypothetical protein RND81_06G225900 [Saponaria officinalis]|uniref:Hydroxyproline-rich glycoprotein family protein n=1 Tax=Saponaria officinalis TaxID=3572 RepID=A0AAW1KEH6_SAPOF
MVDGGSYTKPQRLNSSQTAQIKTNPRKFYKHFVFKPLIIIIFLSIIPFFPSEPPDFVSNTSILSKSWELLQLIFVGIVVSYGLFSRKNDDDDFEGENATKFDAAQNYVSRLLHVTSVFDDDVDDVLDDHDDDHVKKVQTWSSKYVRNEPMLIVAEKNRVVDDKNNKNIGINGEKPLLLPVRSLKSRVSDEKVGDLIFREDYGVSRVYNRSNTSPIEKGFSNNSKKLGVDDVIELGKKNREELGFGMKGNHVRSNSSFSEDVKSRVGVSGEFGFVDDDMKGSRSLNRSNSYVGSRDLARYSRKSSSVDYGGVKDEENVVLPSPIPWQSRSGRMETKGESLDDSSSHSLPPSLEESEAARLLKPQLSHSNSTPSTRFESQGKSGEDFGRRKSNYKSNLPPPPPPPPPPSKTRKPPPPPQKNQESRDEGSVGKSVRTVRLNETRPKEVDLPETKTPMPNGSFLEYPKETRDFLEQVLLETDDESESDGEHYRDERVETTKTDETQPENVNEDESDVDKNVDKKADEFIAKFREQIRLQRIESIKKSTGQLKRSSVR